MRQHRPPHYHQLHTGSGRYMDNMHIDRDGQIAQEIEAERMDQLRREWEADRASTETADSYIEALEHQLQVRRYARALARRSR